MDNLEVHYWSAVWCGPCQNPTFKRGIEELKAEGWTFVKHDADSEKELASQQQIMAVPSFLLYKDDQLVDRFSGAMDKVRLRQRLVAASNKE